MYAAGVQVVPKAYRGLYYPNMQPIPEPLGPAQTGNSSVALSGYGDLEGAGAVAAGIGLTVGLLLLTVGGYVLLAYGVGYGASKGWQKAKKRKERK